MRRLGLLALCGAASVLLACSTDVAPSAPADGVSQRAKAGPTVALDLGPFPGQGGGCTDVSPSYYSSVAFDVNNDDIAVGTTLCAAGEDNSFRWSEAGGLELLEYKTVSGAVNKAGYIAANFSPGFSGSYHPVLWTPENTRIDIATSGWAYDINDKNQVLMAGPGGTWLWAPKAGATYVAGLGSNSSPVAINRQGDILTESAILSANGVLTPISPTFAVQGINGKDEVIGSTAVWHTPDTAVMWSRTKGLRKLGTLGGDISVAYGINNKSEVVGGSTTSSGEAHAFYWNAVRGMVDLGIGFAYAISDAGDIVGDAPSPTVMLESGAGPVWHATLWRGTGGIATSGATARASAAPARQVAACLDDSGNWRSKTLMSRCLGSLR